LHEIVLLVYGTYLLYGKQIEHTNTNTATTSRNVYNDDSDDKKAMFSDYFLFIF